MTQVSPGAALDLQRLKTLKASLQTWLGRPDDGRVIADRILQSRAPIVVLYGPHSGRTAFLRTALVPALEAGTEVCVRDLAATGMDDLTGVAEAPIEIWDRFDAWFTDAIGPAELARRLSPFTEPQGRGSRLIVVVPDDQLSRLFPLRAAVPAILDEVLELPALSGSTLASAIAEATLREGVRVSPALTNAVQADLDAAVGRRMLGPDVVAVVAFELCRAAMPDRSLSVEEYDGLGRLAGLLERHLDYLFDHLPDGVDRGIGWAVLQDVAATPGGHAVGLDGVAARFDVDPDVPALVLRRLEEDWNVVLRLPASTEVVPSLLAMAIEARTARDAVAAEHARSLLRQGVRAFEETETLPSPQHVRRIHEQRRVLAATDEEAALMLRAALVYEDGRSLSDSAVHWQRRVRDEDLRADVLQEALGDSRADVRRRAAALLAPFDRRDVRSQLLLVALRDPDAMVRSVAVDSLEPSRDGDLLAAFVQELADRNSPYRLEAIDALRIFPEPAAVDALVGLVRNRPAQEAAVRARAISVLGRQETPASLDALLHLALHDEDREDREQAALALGRVTRQESGHHVLSRLRASHRLGVSEPSWRISPRAVLTGLWRAGLAAGAVVLTFVVHGFGLATTGRLRLGIAVSVIQWAAVLLGRLGLEWAGFVPAVTLAVGTALPFRTLMLERRDGIPQGWYRRYVGMWLFGVGALSAFVVVHGLASMLTRQMRRGVVLLGFQVVGLFIFSFDVLIEDLLVSAGPAPWLTARVPAMATWAGLVVLAGSYVAGVGTVLWETCIWRRRRDTAQRVHDVYRRLLSNAAVSAIVIDRLSSEAAGERRWATRVVRRYRRLILTRLRDVWTTAAPQVRERILGAMRGRPDADTVDFLRDVAPEQGWRGRARYVAALWQFRVSVWPKPLLLLTGLLLSVLGVYGAVLYEHVANSPVRALNRLEDEALDAAERLEAVRLLQAHAASDGPRVRQLASIFLRLSLDRESVMRTPDLLVAVLQALPGGEVVEDAETSVARLLGDASLAHEQRRLAAQTLGRLGTRLAALRLREFVELTQPTPRAPAERDAAEGGADGTSDPDFQLRLEAVTALGTMVVPDALHALEAIRQSRTIRSGLRDAAAAAIGTFDPLQAATHQFDEARFDDAIEGARTALALNPANARARALLARALGSRGLEAFEEARYEAAAGDFTAALEAQPGELAALSEAFVLGQQLVFVFHDELAPRDEKYYEESYQILHRLQPAAASFGEQVALSVDANLAEASFTTGRYQEAIGLALSVMARLGPGEEAQDTGLAMRFMVLAARTLMRDDEGRARALRDLQAYRDALPAAFTITWQYTGTRAAIQRLAATAEDREALLRELDALHAR